MLWTSISNKLRHLWKIILTYIAYEANISTVTSYLNYLPMTFMLTSVALFI